MPTRMVCDACGAVWFAAPTNQCPSCKGPVREREVKVDGAGVVTPLPDPPTTKVR